MDSTTTTMTPRYVEACHLSDASGHEKGVTTLAFSFGGRYLASGGLDKKICVWDVSGQKLLYTIKASSAVLSARWLGQSEDFLLCGLQDGTLVFIVLTANALEVKGVWAHTFPVEHLTLGFNGLLASGAHPEVFVWRRISQETFHKERALDSPSPIASNHSLDVVVTGLHWAHNGGQDVLVVAYMHHGIMIIDATSWVRLRTIPPYAGCIASTSMSPDGDLLAVSNLSTGFDLHSMRAELPISGMPLHAIAGQFHHEVGEPFPTPVLFIHGGRSLLTGSTMGEPRVWDIGSAKFQPLFTGGSSRRRVLAVAAHQGTSARHGTPVHHVVATAVTKGNFAIVIWIAEEFNVQTGTRTVWTIGRALLAQLATVVQLVVVIVAARVIAREFTVGGFDVPLGWVRG